MGSPTLSASLIPTRTPVLNQSSSSNSPLDADDNKSGPCYSGLKQTTFVEPGAICRAMENNKKKLKKSNSLVEFSHALLQKKHQRLFSYDNTNAMSEFIAARSASSISSNITRIQDPNASNVQLLFNNIISNKDSTSETLAALNNNSSTNSATIGSRIQDPNPTSSPIVNISLSELIIIEIEKPVTCFSAIARIVNRRPKRESVISSVRVEMDSNTPSIEANTPVNVTQSSQSVVCSASSSSGVYELNEMDFVQTTPCHLSGDADCFSTHSNSNSTKEEEKNPLKGASLMVSDAVTKKNDLPQGENCELSINTSQNILYLRLEHLRPKRQLKMAIVEKGSILSEELSKREYFIIANIYLMHRNPNTKESHGTFQEKMALELDEEVVFKNVNSRMMSHSELHVYVRLTNAAGDTTPMGSVVIDCRDYFPDKENIFTIPMTKC